MDVSLATNIAGSQYDIRTNSVAPGGVLVSSVTPGVWNAAISLIEDADLAKADLHNGKPVLNDIVGKFESVAVVSCLDDLNPDDYFVFSAAGKDLSSEIVLLGC